MSSATVVKAPEASTLTGQAAADFVSGKRPAQTPEEAYALLRERFENASKAKQYFERQWIINLAHYLGQPNLGVDNRSGLLVTIPRESPWRVRVNVPIISYLVDTRLARVMRAVPEPMVLPASSADDDRYKAKLATKIIRYMLEKYNFKTKLSEQWLRHCDIEGTGFLKVVFDPLAGDNLIAVPTENVGTPTQSADILSSGPGAQVSTPPQLNGVMPPGMQALPDQEAGGTVQETEYVPEGDIKIEAVSPFKVFVDPAATTLDDAQWLIEAQSVSIRDARRRFPAFAALIDESKETDTPADLIIAGGTTLLNDFPLFGGLWGNDVKDRITMYEMWERASLEYPTGRHIIVIGKHTILDEMTPEEYNEIPYFDVQCFPVPNRYWAQSIVTLLVSLAVTYNRRHSQIVENLNAHAWLRLLVPNGSNMATISKDAHYQVNYDPQGAGGGKPEFMQPPSLPPDAFRQLEELKSNMEEIAGVHDVSRGQNPSTARTGKAIWFLQEADDTRLERIVERYHKAVADACTVILKLVRKHYNAQRIAQVFVPHDVEILEFVGSDIGENVRVVIDPRAKAPLSMSQRIDLFTQLFDLGAFINPHTGVQDTKKFFEFLDLKATDPLFEDDSLHKIRAEKEHQQMRNWNGMGPSPIMPPQQYEDDDVHLEEHRRVTNTDEWFRWTEAQRQAWMQHIQIHEFRQMSQAEMKGTLPIGMTQQLQQGRPPLAAPEASGAPTPRGNGATANESMPEPGQHKKEPMVPNAPRAPTGTGELSGEY